MKIEKTRKIAALFALLIVVGVGTYAIGRQAEYFYGRSKAKMTPDNFAKNSKAAAPRGIFVLTDWDDANSIADQTWQLPDVDGVAVRAYWKDLNPQPEIYNWDSIDAQFVKAGQYNKKIKLMIAPGFYSPEWVLATAGVETARFKVPQGPDRGRIKSLPLPWNDKYLNLWFGFVDKVSARYKDNPDFSYISATGPNSHNGELSLPREDSDEKKWLELTNNSKVVLKEKIINAWYKTIDKYCSAFSGKHFTISIILRSLPLTSDLELDKTYKEELIKYGASKCQDTFGVQTNGLNGVPVYPTDKEPPAHWDYIKDYADKIFVGFQTQAPGNLFPKNKTANKEAIYRRALLINGLSRKADILELYQTNVLDPELSAVVNIAHQKLMAASDAAH